ncbi:MAG TPA: NAD(P)(+) transhydrogenase (Re/Si-specific) subunit beta [Thermomicrobiales bacterium]|nr:NAD(P)(+) transhydrogenase (Re/Si-specific) subunit beta [Thermomicrobiales bacterium]
MDSILENRVVLINIAYLIAAVCFIVGLKLLSSPATARRGNQIAALGMTIAVVATLFLPGMHNIWLILVGLAIGAVAAVYPARSVKMTAMPQMVAIFNGMGGATAALVSLVEFQHKANIGRGEIVSIVLGVIIGSISFSGSMIAFGKLQELISGRPISYPNQQLVNAIIGIVVIALAVIVVALGQASVSYALIVLLFLTALVLGVLTVLPIGGADMPVVIAVLNSMTGVAAALTGFVLNNQALIIAGILVGASGAFLTLLMARAMNRSVSNVLFGAWGAAAAGGGGGEAAADLPMREVTADDAAVPLAYADNVIIVPGYGLAVAQAQHAVRELAETLQERGVQVRYAIHPVAGRMPGHMNVLLAEANVPYDDLYEMEQINEDFANTDVAIVVGANDVTNPAARDDPSSPIYGMPILNVDQAKTIYVLKRGRGAGFAGIENMLFHDPKTAMLFGDAKDSLSRLNAAVREA